MAFVGKIFADFSGSGVNGIPGGVGLVAGSGINLAVSIPTSEIEIATECSGQFPCGVVVQAPNGSGWLMTISDLGELETTGPFSINWVI